MPTIKSLRDQGRALLEDQKALVLDESRPWAERRPEYDKRELDIKAVKDQLARLESVPEPFAAAEMSDPFGMSATTAPRGAAAGLVASGQKPIGAPQLDLSGQQTKELHEAAMAHRSLAVSPRNATDSSSVPPSLIPDYMLPPVTMRREPKRVLSLIPTFPTEHPVVTWYSTTGTAAAAAVAEGGTKPTSTIAYTAQTATVTKLAHVAEVTDETIADFPSFMQVLQQDMYAGLVKAENDELLNATVAGAHKFPGLLSTSGILTRARTTEPYIDALELAFDDLRNGTSFADPDGIVMNPTTWGLLRRQKDSNGSYYIQPDVTKAHIPNLWGVPVVLTTQIASGTVLVGDFAGSTVAYVREGIRVEVANQGENQFKANTTLVRCEQRLVLTVPRPSGLLKVTGIS